MGRVHLGMLAQNVMTWTQWRRLVGKKKHGQPVNKPRVVAGGYHSGSVWPTEITAPMLLSELVRAFHRVAVQWGIKGGHWMDEKWGEQERAASELDSKMETRLVEEYASAAS